MVCRCLLATAYSVYWVNEREKLRFKMTLLGIAARAIQEGYVI